MGSTSLFPTARVSPTRASAYADVAHVIKLTKVLLAYRESITSMRVQVANVKT